MSGGVEALQDWNEQYGDIVAFPEKTGAGAAGGNVFRFDYGMAYACRVRDAKVVRSKFGDMQIEMKLDVQGDDGDHEDVPVVGQTRIWLDLPKQSSDLGKDRALVQKMIARRYQNLLRVLSAAAPATYALYAERKGNPPHYTYVGFDGEKMSPGDFNERKITMQTACVEFAEELYGKEGEPIDILEGALFYVEKVENKKNAKYPYTNYYATTPEKVPVFKGGESAPF